MATIKLPSYRVKAACHERLQWIKNYRNEKLLEAIKATMAKTRFSFREFGRVPRFLSEAEALAELKKDDGDMWGHGSTYLNIMNSGYQTEAAIKQLEGMAGKASEVELNESDYRLIKAAL
jgi:hypothetical protein